MKSPKRFWCHRMHVASHTGTLQNSGYDNAEAIFRNTQEPAKSVLEQIRPAGCCNCVLGPGSRDGEVEERLLRRRPRWVRELQTASLSRWCSCQVSLPVELPREGPLEAGKCGFGVLIFFSGWAVVQNPLSHKIRKSARANGARHQSFQ